ncbi:glycoside hydrolase family 99-like domain-containing protein [Blastococcus sp. BMG 814]|uniref:Glycoside hydrolase family 99-like domain-containing protein n=1 Tax=Blastococcus carthaginiensis TaxID=3050034 RepID=A0ABT9I9T4_9ACTN|nr:glycoside hydrolase family 99-like domain-containing protein [Blastococcus carthaginiensis]MDP5182330.1 glycoside hydrolase family 99-like domain-containing protein [Blastococcus carthaginiensis]
MVDVVAFFLPQFHPIPENDRWWGPGFTEWTHVAAARPLFLGHAQPRLPADLGFYDLRVKETRVQQWDLARRHGVTAFCYWHYWFGAGTRLLHRPLDDLIADSEIPHRYCLGWANEDWTGAWHGRGEEVLQRQLYLGREDDTAHFLYLLPHLRDPRYLTVDDKPVIYLYRPSTVPDLAAFTSLWRDLAEQHGLPGLYLVGEAAGGWVHDPRSGVDAAVWNPPPPPADDWLADVFPVPPLRQQPRVFPYDDRYAQWLLDGIPADIRQHPCVVPGFDNTPRSGARGVVLHEPDPETFQRAVARARARELAEPAPRIVFVKSWNEWAEGNVLEPDTTFGHAFLRALADGLAAGVRGVPQKPSEGRP